MDLRFATVSPRSPLHGHRTEGSERSVRDGVKCARSTLRLSLCRRISPPGRQMHPLHRAPLVDERSWRPAFIRPAAREDCCSLQPRDDQCSFILGLLSGWKFMNVRFPTDDEYRSPGSPCIRSQYPKAGPGLRCFRVPCRYRQKRRKREKGASQPPDHLVPASSYERGLGLVNPPLWLLS